jgi:hypothetical protein
MGVGGPFENGAAAAATRQIQLTLQAGVLALQALQLATQPLNLPILRIWHGRLRRRVVSAFRHALLMSGS